MKKNVKVFIIKAKAVSGNDRTVQAITSLGVSLADVCKMKRIPMLSIVSTYVTAPMSIDEAVAYTATDYAATILAPDTEVIKTEISIPA